MTADGYDHGGATVVKPMSPGLTWVPEVQPCQELTPPQCAISQRNHQP